MIAPAACTAASPGWTSTAPPSRRNLERPSRDARLGPIGGETDEIIKEILGRWLGG
jgi:hypothetical protein